jgi:hypothetical protein
VGLLVERKGEGEMGQGEKRERRKGCRLALVRWVLGFSPPTSFSKTVFKMYQNQTDLKRREY